MAAENLFTLIIYIHASLSQNCEDDGLIKHINWDKLMDKTEGAAEIPHHSCTVDFDTATFVLDVNCDLEYLGYATDNLYLKGNESLGITYSIGMTSFYSTRYTLIHHMAINYIVCSTETASMNLAHVQTESRNYLKVSLTSMIGGHIQKLHTSQIKSDKAISS